MKSKDIIIHSDCEECVFNLLLAVNWVSSFFSHPFDAGKWLEKNSADLVHPSKIALPSANKKGWSAYRTQNPYHPLVYKGLRGASQKSPDLPAASDNFDPLKNLVFLQALSEYARDKTRKFPSQMKREDPPSFFSTS